jgi:DNA recombination protein RmuC
MNERFFEIGGRVFTLEEAIIAGAGALLIILLLAVIGAWRRAARGAEHGAAVEARVGELVRAQSEMSGRMQTMAEVFGTRQSDLLRGLSERMDGLGHRIGQSMTETTRNTHENLAKLNERLGIIDTAQKNITSLSSQVVELQQILNNKQTRGAFGQGRMEAIVQDGLPMGTYEFQATLGNGNRPDCVVFLPNGAPGLVIDAKFPLEAWNAIRVAETPEAGRVAETQFRRDMQKHIQDIADRYFIPGETQDTAFMFVPSESIFGDVHERFEDVIQRAHRARVVIVSPSLLMLSIQVVQSVLRDQRMREQAHVIRDEVMKLMDDVGRLDERVRKLQAHFSQATTDIDNILTSTRKVAGRSARIEALDFGETPSAPSVAPVESERRAGELPFKSFDEV